MSVNASPEGDRMPVLEEVLAANAEYARTFGAKSELALPPDSTPPSMRVSAKATPTSSATPEAGRVTTRSALS